MREKPSPSSLSEKEAIEFGLKEYAEEKESMAESHRFERFLDYLDGKERHPDQEKIEQFRSMHDSIERLELLREMNAIDALECIEKYSPSERPWSYLTNRLDFYQKLFQGKAVRRYRAQEWDGKKGEYVEVTRERSIDASGVTPETIRLGLLRDMMYASMQGTPEMAGVKIATQRVNEKSGDDKKIKSVVELFGYYSGIDEGSIGQWADLRNLYKGCSEEVQRRSKQEELDDKQLEHEAVLLMARRLEDAFNWGGIINTCASPYNPGFREAVTVGRLGDERIKAQLWGMRSKIQETNLQNIERFIGKSGPNKYASELNRLNWQIKNFDALVVGDESVFQQPHLREYAHKLNDLKNNLEKGEITQEKFDAQESELNQWFEDNKTNFLERENQFMQQRQTNWFTHERERLTQKFEKAKVQVEQVQLPIEEKELRLSSLQERFEQDIADLEQEHQEKLDYFQNRTAEQLRENLKERQEVVEERYEKRKSLAQKTLDLHFQFNHKKHEYPEDYLIDWINYAPLGTIKRAHNMLRRGVSEQTVLAVSVADITLGKAGIDRESFTQIERIFKEISKLKAELQQKENALEGYEDRDWNDPEREEAQGEVYGAQRRVNEKQSQVKNLIRVGNILSGAGYALSLNKLIEFSQKNTYGLHEALKEFSLEEVQELLDKDANLQTAATIKRSTLQKGYELELDDIGNLGKHDCAGFENALKVWALDEIRHLLESDVYLPNAIHTNEVISDALANWGKRPEKLPVETVRKLGTLDSPEETILKTIKAGFTPDEITRFPFLISPLVEKG